MHNILMVDQPYFFDAEFLDGLCEFGVSLHCLAAHSGFGGDTLGCCWSLLILSFDLGVLICSGLIRDGQFPRIVEFPPQQRRCIWGQGSLPKLGANFFVNGYSVAGGWEYGHDADGSMSTVHPGIKNPRQPVASHRG